MFHTMYTKVTIKSRLCRPAWGWNRRRQEFSGFGPSGATILKQPFFCCFVYDFFSVFLGSNTAWMLGRTPPCAMVTPDRSLLSSSSLRMANCRCLGMIRVFLLSLAAFPASSSTSAARYSSTAAR
ncbi:unnamed protein product [Ixodes pacificus]